MIRRLCYITPAVFRQHVRQNLRHGGICQASEIPTGGIDLQILIIHRIRTFDDSFKPSSNTMTQCGQE